MSTKIRKVLSLIVATCMIGFTFAGCGQEAKPAAETSTAAAPSSAASESTAATSATSEKPALKAALLLSGPINDGGWNTDAYNGLGKLKEMGYEIAYTENVVQADQQTLIRDYAKKGYNLIIGHGFEYGDALTAVATEFPDAKFLQIGGASTNGKNLASGEFRLGQLSYILAGVAARVTKTNKIGFVGAQEIPTIQAEVDTIKEQVPKINSNATVTVAYTGSWTDINKGKEAAMAQINNGVDVIIGIGDACDAGAIQACQEKGVKFIGWSGDLNSAAPDIVLTSGVQSVSTIISGVGKDIVDGKFSADHKVYGVEEGIEYLGTFSPTLDAAIKDQALKDQEDIKSGKLVLKKIN